MGDKKDFFLTKKGKTKSFMRCQSIEDALLLEVL
jgi:hypothetical protein